MSDRELLEQVCDTVCDPDLKVTAIRDRISGLLADAGYLKADGDENDEHD